MKDDKKFNPPPQAVALYYDGENTPQVTAKGQREVAERIIALAQEHGIPMHQDAELTQFLSQLDLGETIPRNLYIAVAKVIAFAYMLNDKHPKGYSNSNKSS